MNTKEIKPLVKEVILSRKSPFTFSSKPVSNEDLHELFDAARWAASSYNEQPWRFIYAQKENNPEAHNKLFSLLMEGNQAWAQEAPVYILVVAKKHFSSNGKSNYYATYDSGMAMANLAIQATAMGIFLHQMGGFDRNKAHDVFDLGDEFEAVAMVALGYPGDPDSLSDSLKERANKPRVRKSVNEIAFEGELKG